MGYYCPHVGTAPAGRERSVFMTAEQKEQIKILRMEGMGYIRVAQALGLSENTVKSFCRRQGLNSGTSYVSVTGKQTEKEVKSAAVITGEQSARHFCLNCGVVVEQSPNRKEKKFCSDKCRMTWWNANPNRLKRKAIYRYRCPQCNQEFEVYGNAKRKYCSHGCYIAARFKGGDADE